VVEINLRSSVNLRDLAGNVGGGPVSELGCTNPAAGSALLAVTSAKAICK